MNMPSVVGLLPEALLALLWEELPEQIRRYTQGDSTSVRTQTALSLWESMVFSVAVHQKGRPVPPGTQARPLLRAAAQTMAAWNARARMICYAVRTYSVPPNRTQSETLRSIDASFSRYDPVFFAQEFIADIDYPLCHPVSESLRGPIYLCEYLSCLLIENEALSAYPRDAAERVLAAAVPSHREEVLNQFEIVLPNAIARALLDMDPRPLDWSETLQKRLERRVRTSGGVDTEQAGAVVTDRLGLRAPGATAYVQALGQTLRPRLSQTNWAGVFLCTD